MFEFVLDSYFVHWILFMNPQKQNTFVCDEWWGSKLETFIEYFLCSLVHEHFCQLNISQNCYDVPRWHLHFFKEFFVSFYRTNDNMGMFYYYCYQFPENKMTAKMFYSWIPDSKKMLKLIQFWKASFSI